MNKSCTSILIAITFACLAVTGCKRDETRTWYGGKKEMADATMTTEQSTTNNNVVVKTQVTTLAPPMKLSKNDPEVVTADSLRMKMNAAIEAGRTDDAKNYAGALASMTWAEKKPKTEVIIRQTQTPPNN